MRKSLVLLAIAVIVLAFECPAFRASSVQDNPHVAAQTVDVKVMTCTDINTWLMSQTYHAPQLPVAWMKLDPSGSTCPVAPIAATVERLDNNGAAPLVTVLVEWMGHATGGTWWLFDFTFIFMPPLSGPVVVTGFVSNVAPPPGDWTLEIHVTVTSGEINIDPSPNYIDSSFRMLGYCDINGNYVVDAQDYMLVKRAMGSVVCGPKWRWSADINCNNAVTVADYVLVKTRIPTIYTPA